MNFLQIFEIVLLADVLDGKLPILNAGCKKFKLFVNFKQIPPPLEFLDRGSKRYTKF